VAFFHEPETARAALAAQPWPPVTESGEQYAVAALLYYLLTGLHYVDFSLGRDELMHEIANMPPVPLVQRGLPEWPALEHCLFRALSKDPAARFATTAAMADALDEMVVPPTAGRAMSKAERLQPALASLGTAADQMLAATALDQPWFTTGLPLGPTASINYGAAGVAYVLGRVARARQDPALLARAEAWAYRAARLAATDPAAFVNPGGEIAPASVGAVSPYHTHSGVAAVGALLADMGGDAEWHTRAVADFLSRAGGPVSNLDLTLGLSSTIVGACQLLRTVPEGNNPLRRELTAFCAERVGRLWTELDQKPRIAESDIDNLGMAHGWAGFIYATLLWSELTHSPLPGGLRARLDQLAELAEPSARGLTWPWALVKGSEANYMSGWCNGSAGHAHLWATATRVMDEPRFTELAIGAAWDAWDAPDTSATLCCGLAGRAYALLAIYRLTGDTAWLDRAKELAARAPNGEFEHEYPHSLYMGQLAIPVLSADLDDPEHAAQPFFELD
jgi:serine/threonine-protein kinase